MVGYNKRERADTFDEHGWYHTGDRVYRRAGDPRLFYVGRSTDLIKAAGANVSPLEVEAVIAEFGDVAQCVVLGIDDPDRGEEVVRGRGAVGAVARPARACRICPRTVVRLQGSDDLVDGHRRADPHPGEREIRPQGTSRVARGRHAELHAGLRQRCRSTGDGPASDPDGLL